MMRAVIHMLENELFVQWYYTRLERRSVGDKTARKSEWQHIVSGKMKIDMTTREWVLPLMCQVALSAGNFYSKIKVDVRKFARIINWFSIFKCLLFLVMFYIQFLIIDSRNAIHLLFLQSFWLSAIILVTIKILLLSSLVADIYILLYESFLQGY